MSTKPKFVYVTYISGDELMINKFSSCASGLQPQNHFPVEIVDDISEPDCPVDGQFNNNDRCTSNAEASPQPAVSADHPNNVFVASAEKSSDQNDNHNNCDSNPSFCSSRQVFATVVRRRYPRGIRRGIGAIHASKTDP